jgi:hypothetical protein
VENVLEMSPSKAAARQFRPASEVLRPNILARLLSGAPRKAIVLGLVCHSALQDVSV